MDTRGKLEEASYFLFALRRTEKTLKQFVYNLSAFLSAWRSVLDVMLYDFAEHYRIGLTREDRMTDEIFWYVAKAQNNAQALGFIKWWRQKVNILSKNPLWNMRRVIVHRGYPEITYRIYIPASISSGGTGFVLGVGEVSAKPSDILDMCEKAFAEMESIVSEAENEFGIQV